VVRHRWVTLRFNPTYLCEVSKQGIFYGLNTNTRNTTNSDR
jgi:hypothetical protein